MRRLIYVSLAAVLTTSAFAQSAEKNPVTSVLREILPRQQNNLVAAVEEMPADKFNYKPTEQQQTFAHLVLHMTTSNMYLCSKIGGSAPPKQEQEMKESDGKDKLLTALKASFDYCNAAIDKMDDSKLGQTIEAYGGRKAPLAWALIALTNDWADHYGGAAMYLRLSGLLPPTAKKEH